MTQSLSELAGVPRFPREQCKETPGLRRAYPTDISAIKRCFFFSGHMESTQTNMRKLVFVVVLLFYLDVGLSVRFYTEVNDLCVTECAQNGESYYWCYTDGGWGFCSTLENVDYRDRALETIISAASTMQLTIRGATLILLTTGAIAVLREKISR